MEIKWMGTIIWLQLICSTYTHSQSVEHPNYSLKSHETMEISKIEMTAQRTMIHLSVENRIPEGSFCADKNIFIIFPDGARSKLSSSGGIPVCPLSYKFKTIGEKLNFNLVFPPLKPGTEWIDLIEDCPENCFSFYGITLDPELNKKIDDAFVLAENKEPGKALISFINLAEANDKKKMGIEGLLYMSIIKLAKETGNTEIAADWYLRLKSSGAPRYGLYMKHLNSQGIKY